MIFLLIRAINKAAIKLHNDILNTLVSIWSSTGAIIAVNGIKMRHGVPGAKTLKPGLEPTACLIILRETGYCL